MVGDKWRSGSLKSDDIGRIFVALWFKDVGCNLKEDDPHFRSLTDVYFIGHSCGKMTCDLQTFSCKNNFTWVAHLC